MANDELSQAEPSITVSEPSNDNNFKKHENRNSINFMTQLLFSTGLIPRAEKQKKSMDGPG